ncbi:MAG: hypothetical protein CMJ18_24165 [Phycisphaeraceae bacterium]|nr:hypothetical protein [Phycisphaeraceae bacterium]
MTSTKLIVTGTALVIFLTATGCATSPATSGSKRVIAPTPVPLQSEGTFTFFFWPDQNVYMDVNSNTYFWIDSGSQQSGEELPNSIMGQLAGAVVVKRPTANPHGTDGFAQAGSE